MSPNPAAPVSTAQSKAPAPTDLPQLLAQLGQEAAQPLSEALERLQSVMRSCDAGTASRLSTVREPLRRARDAILLASQIGRLASGPAPTQASRVALHQQVRQVAEHRQREAQARGVQLRAHLVEAEVQLDPALLVNLLHALVDWALWHTRSSIDLQLSLTPWPVRVRLECRFACTDLDQLAGGLPPQRLEDLRWQLLQQLASSLGAPLQQHWDAGLAVTHLLFEMPKLQEMLQRIDLNAVAAAGAHDSQPFVGLHALVVSDDSSLQDTVQPLLRRQGWAVEGVAGVDEAFQHCLNGLPQAVIVDAALRGPDLDQWCTHVLAELPSACIVEVVDGDSALLPFGRTTGVHRCLRERLGEDLPVQLRTLMLEGANDALTLRL